MAGVFVNLVAIYAALLRRAAPGVRLPAVIRGRRTAGNVGLTRWFAGVQRQ
jgi:hypothetical protein